MIGAIGLRIRDSPVSPLLLAVYLVVSMAAGVGTATSWRLTGAALVFAPMLLFLRGAVGRLLVVSAGALLALGGSASSALDLPKLAYSASVGATALLPLMQRRRAVARRAGDRRHYSNVMSASWWAGGALAASSFAGLMRGNRPLDILRDLSPYLLIVLTAAIVLDTASHVRPKTTERILLAVGISGAVQYFLYFSFVRGVSSIGASGLLASTSLCVMLFCYAVARALTTTRKRGRWIFIGLTTLTLGILTGNRSMLSLVIAIPTCVWLLRSSPGGTVRPLVRSLGSVLLVLPILVFASLAVGPSIDTRTAFSRVLGGVQSLVSSDWRYDSSGEERSAQTRQAIQTFSNAPLLGAGPGHIFRVERPTSGTTTEGFSMDTLFVVPAKFGVFGSVALFLLVTSWVGLARRDWRRNGLTHWHAAFVSFLVVQATAALVNPVVEDKAFGVAAILLLGGMLAHSNEHVPRKRVSLDSPDQLQPADETLR